MTNRSFFVCPVPSCGWMFGWALGLPNARDFAPPESNPHLRGDPDLGLAPIALHMEMAHSEIVYGALIPASVLRRVLEMAQAR